MEFLMSEEVADASAAWTTDRHFAVRGSDNIQRIFSEFSGEFSPFIGLP